MIFHLIVIWKPLEYIINNMFNKCLSFLYLKKDKINNFLSIFLISYVALLILPYLFGGVEVINNFFATGWSKIFYRSLTILYAITYLGLVGLSNKIKIKWYFLLGGLLLLINLLISSLVCSHEIYKLDGSLGIKLRFIDYFYDYLKFGSSIILFIFMVSFIHPIIKSLKVFTIPLLVVIGITFIGVIVSFIVEFDLIKQLISGANEHEVDLHSFFQNKNTFGLFLFLSSLSIGFLVYSNPDDNKYLYLFIPLILFTFMAIIAGCRTALIACLFLLIYLVIRSLLIVYSLSKKAFYISIGVVSSIVVLLILFMANPFFHDGSLKGIYFVINYSLVRFSEAFSGRMAIWGDSMKFMNGTNLVFGANFTNSPFYLLVYNGHFRDFHSGYVTWFTATGIVGSLVYLSLFVYVFVLIIKTIKKKPYEGLLVLVFLLVSMLFIVPETYTLFISTSLFSFLTNIVIVVYLKYLLKEDNYLVTHTS